MFNPLGAIDKTDHNKQVLDKLQVERERGITVKAQTASLFYRHEGTNYLLNLIDTPVSELLSVLLDPEVIRNGAIIFCFCHGAGAKLWLR